jgi:hypothetical protein
MDRRQKTACSLFGRSCIAPLSRKPVYLWIYCYSRGDTIKAYIFLGS